MKMKKSTLLQLLIAWRQGIHEYYSRNNRYSNVFLTLDTIVSRKIEKLRVKFYDNSILEISLYLEECLAESEKLQKANILQDLSSITNKFKLDFENEIKKAKKLIQDNMYRYIEERNRQLSFQIGQIVQEVNQMKETLREEVGKLLEQREELGNKLILRSIFSVVKFVFLAISFINPVCAIVGSLLLTGAHVAESEILDSDDNSNFREIKLPKGVFNSLERSFQTYDHEVRKKLTKRSLKNIRNPKSGPSANPLGLKISEPKEKKGTFATTSKELKIDHQLTDNRSLEAELKPKLSKRSLLNFLQSKTSKEFKMDHQLTDNRPLKAELKPKLVKRSLLNFLQDNDIDIDPDSIVDLGKETYEKISNDLSKMEQIDPSIAEKFASIEKLEAFKKKIIQNLSPKIHQIRERIQLKTDDLLLSSITILEFEKWRLDEYLTDITTEFELMTQELRVEANVKTIMRKMKNAVKMTIHLHTIIKHFHSKITEANHMENIASAPFQITDIQNVKIRKPLTILMHNHYANDILDEYQKWLIAFKQYTFPFVDEFPDIIESSIIPPPSDPIIKANFVIEKMKFFKSHLNKRKAHGKLFKNTSNVRFGDKAPFSSFYHWINNSAIHDILQGKEVKLFANISRKKNLSAVKFRNVNIKFHSDDKRIGEEIENDLEKFSLTLTHNGDSYYRCDEHIYLIESSNFEFGNKFFESRRKRFVLDELDYVLSPYATWTIRLNAIAETGNFSSLAKYANKVNIQLVGEGQYMYSNLTLCNGDFRKYYGEEIFL